MVNLREGSKARVVTGGCSKSCFRDTEVVLSDVVICRSSQALGNGEPLKDFKQTGTHPKLYLRKLSMVGGPAGARGREPLWVEIWDLGSEGGEK